MFIEARGGGCLQIRFLRRYFKPAAVQGTERAEEAGSEQKRKQMRPGSVPADFPQALKINSSKKESPLLHARSDASLYIHELTDDDVRSGGGIHPEARGPGSHRGVLGPKRPAYKTRRPRQLERRSSAGRYCVARSGVARSERCCRDPTPGFGFRV